MQSTLWNRKTQTPEERNLHVCKCTYFFPFVLMGPAHPTVVWGKSFYCETTSQFVFGRQIPSKLIKTFLFEKLTYSCCYSFAATGFWEISCHTLWHTFSSEICVLSCQIFFSLLFLLTMNQFLDSCPSVSLVLIRRFLLVKRKLFPSACS